MSVTLSVQPSGDGKMELTASNSYPRALTLYVNDKTRSGANNYIGDVAFFGGPGQEALIADLTTAINHICAWHDMPAADRPFEIICMVDRERFTAAAADDLGLVVVL